MPSFKNVNAVLPVADHAAAVAWYSKWIGRKPDVEPTEGVAEWEIASNAWIQDSLDPDAAGKTTVVVGVDDIDATVADLGKEGVTCGEMQDYGFVKLTEIVDPDGNKVTFAWENPDFDPSEAE